MWGRYNLTRSDHWFQTSELSVRFTLPNLPVSQVPELNLFGGKKWWEIDSNEYHPWHVVPIYLFFFGEIMGNHRLFCTYHPMTFPCFCGVPRCFKTWLVLCSKALQSPPYERQPRTGGCWFRHPNVMVDNVFPRSFLWQIYHTRSNQWSLTNPGSFNWFFPSSGK